MKGPAVSGSADVKRLARAAARDPQVLHGVTDVEVLNAVEFRVLRRFAFWLQVTAGYLVVVVVVFASYDQVRLIPLDTKDAAITWAAILALGVLAWRTERAARALVGVLSTRSDQRMRGLDRSATEPDRVLGTVRLEIDAWFDDGDIYARFVRVRDHDLKPADVAMLADEFVEDTDTVEDAIASTIGTKRPRIASATVLVEATIASRDDELVLENARVLSHEREVLAADRRGGVAFDGDLSDLVDYALADLGESVR